MDSRARFSPTQFLFLICIAVLILPFVACGGGTTAGDNPQAKDWDYLALGDSLANGLLATNGYVSRYESYVNKDTGANVHTTNLAVPGWHSGDLLNAIQNDTDFRNNITNAEVLTWDIGGDDLATAHDSFTKGTCGGTDNQDCLRSAVATFKQNWDSIISNILQLRTTGNTIIRTMDIYNPYVNSDMQAGTFDTVEPYLDEVNNYIHSTAQANNIPVANVHEAFNGADGRTDPSTQGLIAVDGFHPNDDGHKVIADQLRALQYAPLH
jgi:lysophospholipase L1-like esterase